MSLILDALNRSEAERRGGAEVPGLATEHFSGSDGDKLKLRGYLPWLALAIAVVVIAWLVLDRAREKAGTVAQPAPVVAAVDWESPPTPAPAVRQRQEPAAPVDRQQRPAKQTSVVPKEAVAAAPDLPVADRATPSARPADATVAALYQRAPATTQTAEATVQAAESMSEVKASGAVPVDTRLTQMTTDRPGSSSRVSEPLDIEAAVASARQEMENARLVEHPAPFIQDLSQQRKDAIPTLMYSIHNYSGKAGQSSVMLNGKSLRAGANVGKGVKLDEILPESIVLSYQGEQFRLRALNSWVNL